MSDFLNIPGAVESTDAPGAVAHFGDPVREQRLLAAGDAIVELASSAVISVTGPDRLTWLDSMTSQSLTGLQPGDSAETLMLDAQGRIEYAIHVVDDGTAAWLIVGLAEVEALAAWLDRMRFMLRVDVVRSELRVVGTIGSLAARAASPHGVPLVWHDPWPTVVSGGHQYAEASAHPGANWTWSEHLVEAATLAELADAAAAGDQAVAGMLAVEALRIAAWRPRRDSEVDERSIPHELDWMRSAVHLNKGCYRGQETVAKVHNLGHPPRRLVMLHLDGSDAELPVRGDEVFADADSEKPIGSITSVALHYELGPIALAVVRRNTDPQLTLSVGDRRVAASQEIVVPPSAGATASVPRLKRLG